MFHLAKSLRHVLWATLEQGDRPAGVHEASAVITNVPAVLLFACVMARRDDDRVIQAIHGLLSWGETETQVVVAVVRRVPVAVSGTHVHAVVVPGAAAHNAGGVSF